MYRYKLTDKLFDVELPKSYITDFFMVSGTDGRWCKYVMEKDNVGLKEAIEIFHNAINSNQCNMDTLVFIYARMIKRYMHNSNYNKRNHLT